MKAKYIYIALLGLMSVVGTSCEDRLDIPKHGNMGGQNDFYKTDNDAMQAAASLYNSWGGNYYNWSFTLNLLSDDVWCGGGGRGDNSDMEKLNEYNFDTDHGIGCLFRYVWYHLQCQLDYRSDGGRHRHQEAGYR